MNYNNEIDDHVRLSFEFMRSCQTLRYCNDNNKNMTVKIY